MPDTGITVSEIKIYDDRTLQLMMLDLASRLGQVSPVDQASLIAKIGSLQGANSSISSFSLQVAGPSVPGVATKTTSSAPTVQEITSATPSTTVNSPGMQTEVTRTAGAITPSAPALPTYGSMAAPTAYGVSSLDALGEQVQLGYELTNLRLLLQGSLNDDYGSNNDARRHVTFGFPISIETPSRRYRDAVAEVEVAVCNPPENIVNDAPLVQHVLPREKTYNVASLTSSSTQLGVSAVISSLVNVGGSFLHGRQTYYMVRDQDTIAVERPSDAASFSCRTPKVPALPQPDGHAADASANPTLQPAPSSATGASPAVFAWQFRPVLGRRTVQQGMRQTFAQIAFAPGIADPGRIPELRTWVRTCWRRYDPKTAIVGDKIACSGISDRQVRMAFDTTKINGLQATDNEDGTISVALNGTYPVGTRIGYGDVAAGDGNVGFSNVRGRLRFTAPNQLLALRGARILSPDGSERDVVDGGPFWRDESRGVPQFSMVGILPAGSRFVYRGQSYAITQQVDRALVAAPLAAMGDSGARIAIGGRTCGVPDPGRVTAGSFKTLSATQVEVTLQIQVCPELGPQGASFKLYAVLGGKAYGLSDSPLTSSDATQVTFTAPRSAIQGKTPVVLRRLLTHHAYDQRFVLDGSASSSVASIALMEASSAGATFVITGTRLTGTRSLSPAGLPITTPDDTIAIVKLDSQQMGKTKKLLLALSDGQAVVVDVPAVDAAPAAKKTKLKPAAAVSRTAPAAVQIEGTNLDLVASVEWLGKQIPFVRAGDGTSIIITGLPPELFASQGVATLLVRSTEGTSQSYDLTVGP